MNFLFAKMKIKSISLILKNEKDEFDSDSSRLDLNISKNKIIFGELFLNE